MDVFFIVCGYEASTMSNIFYAICIYFIFLAVYGVDFCVYLRVCLFVIIFTGVCTL